MLHDVDTPEGRAAFAHPFDVCVIGSGPAGITLARRLAAQGLEVALMEAGGLEWSEESQDLYAGESVGLTSPPLDGARLRYLGGSSGHWNGLCRPFDPADFAARPGNPEAGWPIGRADLDPYTADAHDILDLVPIPADGPAGDLAAGTGFQRIHYFRSPPTRFGEKYLDELTTAPRIALGINANLVDLRLDDARATVTGAVFKGYAPGDPGLTVTARAYALCCGGIENPRLLLNLTSQVPAGIGNQNDLVGRYFSDHPAPPPPLGEVIFARVPKADTHFFALSDPSAAELGVLPMSVRINHVVRKPLAFEKELARSLQCTIPYADRVAEAVLGDKLRCDDGGLEAWWQARDPDAYPWGRVVFNAVGALDPESRVTLGDAVDPFGLRRARLDWRLGAIDDRTVRETTLAFAAFLADTGLARMKVADWVLDDPLGAVAATAGRSMSSWHHMCTTRMSDDPKKGVVDRDCRIHGMTNLFVGGSSVFSSTGPSNPTYTIVQLALRQGDHLGQLLQGA